MDISRRSFLQGIPAGLVAVGGLHACQNRAEATVSDELITQANGRFAANLYGQLIEENEDKDLFCSPFSISSALAMTLEGARRTTARQIGTVLGYSRQLQRSNPGFNEQPWLTDRIHSAMGQLSRTFNASGKAYRLSVANALWMERSLSFRKEFLAPIQRAYDAAAFKADFANDFDRERIRINKWVEKKTEDRIKNLLPKDSLNALTRLVVTNAIYFKGMWRTPFDPKRTHKSMFTLQDGNTTSSRMMSLRSTPFQYAEFKAPAPFQVLSMPYEGEELSMVFLLPRHHNRLRAIEAGLSSDKLTQWIDRTRRTKVDVSIPKFKAETTYELNRTLSSMGMSAAFRPGDFTGLSDSPEAKSLYISQVLHKAFVEVDEEGTEAAAATAVVIKARSAGIQPRIAFTANRPFVYLIRDDRSGSILFMGRVMNPQSS